MIRARAGAFTLIEIIVVVVIIIILIAVLVNAVRPGRTTRPHYTRISSIHQET